jgi:hypothetical protein
VTVLSNAENTSSTEIGRKIMSVLIVGKTDLDVVKPEYIVKPELLAPYAGTYVMGEFKDKTQKIKLLGAIDMWSR